MTITKTVLMKFQGGPYSTAAETLDDTANGMNSAGGTISGYAGAMGDWQGSTADAASATTGNAVAALSSSVNVMSGLDQCVQDFVTQVSRAQHDFNDALTSLNGLTWPAAPAEAQEDGSVTLPPQPSVPGKPSKPTGSNPDMGAYNQAMGAYNQAVQDEQMWQAAAKQVPGIQSRLQNALQQAQAADSQASGALGDGTGGANDFTITVNQGVSAAGAGALFDLGQSLSSEGSAWTGKEAQAAITLAQQAKSDPAAAKELNQVYGPQAKQDNVFATDVLNQLGPAGLDQLAAQHGYAQLLTAGEPNPAQDPFFQFLSTTLASGTALTGQATDYPGQAVSQDWLNQLTQVSGKTYDEGGSRLGVPGYWGLGQIMQAASQPGQVPYSTKFLTTVGPAMVTWDRTQNRSGKDSDQGGYGVGPTQGSLGIYDDPMVGLLTAADTNVPGAQALFATQVPGVKSPGPGIPPTVETYLIADHHWNQNTQEGWTDGSDNGSALGHTFQLVTEAPGGQPLAVQGINAYGAAAKAGGTSYGNSISGFRGAAGTVLADNIKLLNESINPEVTSPQFFQTQDLAYAISQVGQDAKGYQTLLGAQVLLSKAMIASAAQQPDPTTALQGEAAAASDGLGFIVGSRDQGLQLAGKAAQAAAAKNQTEVSSLVNFGVGLLPIPAPLVATANEALNLSTGNADIGTLASKALPDGSGAVQGALDTTADDSNNINRLVSQMVVSAAAANPTAYHLGSIPPGLTLPVTTQNVPQWENYLFSGQGGALQNLKFQAVNGENDGVDSAKTNVPVS